MGGLYQFVKPTESEKNTYINLPRANVDIKEENSGPKNIIVDESDFDHLTRIDRIQFY